MNEILYSRHFGGDVQGFALYGAKLLFPLFLCVWRNLIKCTNVCVCHTLYVHLCVREGYYKYCHTTAQFSCFVGYLKRLSLQPFIYLPRKCVCNLRVWIHGQGLGLAPKRIADILDTNWQSNSCIIIIRVSLFVTLMLDDYWSVCVCARTHRGCTSHFPRQEEKSGVNCGRCQGTWSRWNVKVTVDTVGYFLLPPPLCSGSQPLGVTSGALLFDANMWRENEAKSKWQLKVSLIVNRSRARINSPTPKKYSKCNFNSYFKQLQWKH